MFNWVTGRSVGRRLWRLVRFAVFAQLAEIAKLCRKLRSIRESRGEWGRNFHQPVTACGDVKMISNQVAQCESIFGSRQNTHAHSLSRMQSLTRCANVGHYIVIMRSINRTKQAQVANKWGTLRRRRRRRRLPTPNCTI